MQSSLCFYGLPHFVICQVYPVTWWITVIFAPICCLHVTVPGVLSGHRFINGRTFVCVVVMSTCQSASSFDPACTPFNAMYITGCSSLSFKSLSGTACNITLGIWQVSIQQYSLCHSEFEALSSAACVWKPATCETIQRCTCWSNSRDMATSSLRTLVFKKNLEGQNFPFLDTGCNQKKAIKYNP